MKDIKQVLDKYGIDIENESELIKELSDLYNAKLSLFQKNRLDLINWAKSELSQELNPKLGKTMTAYRSEKIIFLRRVIKWIE